MPEFPDRRSFLRLAGVAAAIRAVAEQAAAGEAGADDEDFWRGVRRCFDLDRRFVDLQSSSVSPSPMLAHSALARGLETVNSLPAYHLFHYGRTERIQARRRLARAAGCAPEELALVRNTTEAMTIAIHGIDFEPGDEVVTTSRDYPAFLAAWRIREKRESLRLRVVDLPFGPLSRERIAESVLAALGQRTRALMICHVLMGCGQVLPVEAICAEARRRGIATLVDGAHGFGHAPCDLGAIGCDYYGCSLHKWANAPLGTGFLYFRRERIAATRPLFAPYRGSAESAEIEKFESYGTAPPVFAALGPALDLFEAIGAERRRRRLRWLTERWTKAVGALPGVEFRTNLDEGESHAFAAVAVRGCDANRMFRFLLDERGILAGVTDGGRALSVASNVYTAAGDVDAFAAALAEIAANPEPYRG